MSLFRSLVDYDGRGCAAIFRAQVGLGVSAYDIAMKESPHGEGAMDLWWWNSALQVPCHLVLATASEAFPDLFCVSSPRPPRALAFAPCVLLPCDLLFAPPAPICPSQNVNRHPEDEVPVWQTNIQQGHSCSVAVELVDGAFGPDSPVVVIVGVRPAGFSGCPVKCRIYTSDDYDGGWRVVEANWPLTEVSAECCAGRWVQPTY